MIVEHEIIEQIEEEPAGWTLSRVCRLISELGRSDAMRVLEQMRAAGHIALLDETGVRLAAWRSEQVWRDGRGWSGTRVAATELGCAWVHG